MGGEKFCGVDLMPSDVVGGACWELVQNSVQEKYRR